MSQTVFEGPFDFEITRVDCIIFTFSYDIIRAKSAAIDGHNICLADPLALNIYFATYLTCLRNEFYFSKVHRSVNYIGSLAK